MKLYEFLALSDELQYQAVRDLGEPIDSIIFGKINYQLYSINSSEHQGQSRDAE